MSNTLIKTSSKMKTFNLVAHTRVGEGKKAAKSLRKEGLIPAVIYGGAENHSISLKEKDVQKLIFSPDIFLVEMTLDDKPIHCIVQDIQFHPVTDRVLHIDFLEVFPDKPISIEVPVVLDGFAAGVRAGGKLSLDMRKIRVRGLYKHVPERLHIDVTKLKLGQTIQIGELEFENLDIMNAKNAVVCAVRLTRAARGMSAVDEDEEHEHHEEGAAEADTHAAE